MQGRSLCTNVGQDSGKFKRDVNWSFSITDPGHFFDAVYLIFSFVTCFYSKKNFVCRLSQEAKKVGRWEDTVVVSAEGIELLLL